MLLTMLCHATISLQAIVAVGPRNGEDCRSGASTGAQTVNFGSVG